MARLQHIIESQRPKTKDDKSASAVLSLITEFAEGQREQLSNKALARGIVAALESMMAQTEAAIDKLDQSKVNGEVSKALRGIADTQKQLARQITAIRIPETDLTAITQSVDNLRAVIQSVDIPEPDMTPVLAELRRLGQKRIDLSPITERLDKKEVWEFVPERDDFSNRITKVTGTRIA